jgi:DNA-damage-inducible protein D
MNIQVIIAEFEAIKQRTSQGAEWWSARDLQAPLGYVKWQNFSKVLGKARDACEAAGMGAEGHFTDISKMIPLGNGGLRPVEDMMLSRHACYLIAMNGLRGNQTRSKVEANITHREIGKKVRKAIADIGGTMPENLPAEPSIKKAESHLKKKIGKPMTVLPEPEPEA